MNDVGIIGVGLTRYTKHSGSLKSLAEEAALAAMAEAGLAFKDLQAIFVGTSYSEYNGNGQCNLRDLPTQHAPIVNIENACASGASALQDARAWIRAGMADFVLVIGMDKTSWVQSGPLPMPEGRWYLDLGLMTPNWYGLQASRYLNDHNLNADILGHVSVKSRKLGVENPVAHFRSSVTLEEVLSSRVIASPFTLHQCCPKTDGVGAIVVASARAAARIGAKPTWIKAGQLMSGRPEFTDTYREAETADLVAQATYAEAGVEPSDLDVLELHDAFTIGEFIYSEAMGICERGGYGEYLLSGRSMPNGGGVAVNPSGGLLARGHPISATGIAQIAEVVWQLRGDAGGRQVEGARLGATLTMGAFEWERDTNVAVSYILEAS